MRISNKTAVQSILFLLQERGINQIVYSPGSRNAPFAIGLDSNPYFTVHVKVDERSAAFFALGLAQQTKKPVVLICTSGTAPLNYAPAIAEAFYQEIPLVVITADRPAESINQSEGQCIDQVGIYNNFIKAQSNLIEEALLPHDVAANHRSVDCLLQNAMIEPRGPVHINVPFQEPLYLESDAPVSETQVSVGEKEITSEPLQIGFDQNKKYLFLFGQNDNERLANLLKPISELPNVLILTETHSNLHGLGGVDCIDRWIMSLSQQQVDELNWDVAISLGHNIISRKIKVLIKKKAKSHWSVQRQDKPIDTYRLSPKVFNCSVEEFLEQCSKEIQLWQLNVPQTSQFKMDSPSVDWNRYFATRPFSDVKLFHSLSEAWPYSAQIQMGNSSTVRYIQLFDQRRDLRFFGNRGVSGIDGSTSTAVGAAVATAGDVVLVTGDLSFLYDANGLWHQPWPKNLKIVVVDNGGGGIFKIIDGAKNESSVPHFFETPHRRDITQWVKGWGLSALELKEPTVKDLQSFFNDSEHGVLIVKTPSEVNPNELDLFFEFYKQQNERVENN
jgi:2-succinyl-5-enolpyruvyl-6-hydroxy-3-cyclohexene-1-carboxylate synthase